MTGQPDPIHLAELQAEAVANDPTGSSSSWGNARPDERPRRLADAAATRANLAAQEAEATRPLTPAEAAMHARIQALRMIGQPLDDFLAAQAEVAWCVEGIAIEGGLIAVLGQPESFKTQGLMHLGLAGAGGAPDWLGARFGPPRPFVYVSGEKSRSTVAEKLRRMSAAIPPTQPVQVVHRTGVTFGDRERWGELVAGVESLGPRTCVVADTLASLAGVGFDENSGQDMSVALGAVRQLTDVGATVFLGHHPNKHGTGSGGVRLRGHSSLWGEVDGLMEFKRPDRDLDAGSIVVEPKDGDLAILRFTWNRETFLLEPETAVRALTVTAVVELVEVLDRGDGARADAIVARFSGHKRTAVMDRLAEAVGTGHVRKAGQSRSTRYLRAQLPDATMFPDTEP